MIRLRILNSITCTKVRASQMADAVTEIGRFQLFATFERAGACNAFTPCCTAESKLVVGIWACDIVNILS
jgi:hypothetical protein